MHIDAYPEYKYFPIPSDTRLQGIMVFVFITFGWMFVLMARASYHDSLQAVM